MEDKDKTKEQLLEELRLLRDRNEELRLAGAEHRSLEEMWRQYEFIVNTSREFLSLIDINYNYIAVNNAYCRAHDKKREDIIGRSVSDIWGEGPFRDIIKGHLDDCFSGSDVHYLAEFNFAAIGPRNIDVTCYPYYGKDYVTHAVVVSRDVTAEKIAEQELIALKKAVETMQLGVTLTDTNGKILFTNPAEAAMHGYSVEELVGQDVKVLAPQELWKHRTARQLNEIKSWRRECENLRKDGKVFPVRLMSDVVKNQDGRTIGVITTSEDITERRRAEKQIQSQLKRLTALREIDMVILSSLDLRVSLGIFLDHLLRELNIDAAAIMLLNPHTLTLEYAQGRGFGTYSVRQARLRLGEGLAGRVALERRMLHVPRLQERETDAEEPCHVNSEGFKVYYGLPLIAKGHVKGTLEIFHRAPIDPGPEWLDFMESMAAQAAIAIDNATMFNDLQNSNIELSLAYDTTLDGWSRALDLRDKETEGHSQRVTAITEQIARAMGIGESELVHVRRGAMLHDIGKMGIPDNILLKPGPLSQEEWIIMKRHPVYAYEMLAPINFLRPAIDIPYCHHEKWDGTGYPRGLKGDKIPVAARIFSIADVWDALCSARSYRPAFSHIKALEHVRSLGNTFFDPEVLKVFLEMNI